MKTEIERKFLVENDGWRAVGGEGLSCEQGYISSDPEGATVRVRLIGGQGFLTLKGPTHGISRSELKYEIPAEEAKFMLRTFCGERIVSKTRFLLEVGGARWEIDLFAGRNKGLILAEIELDCEDQPFEKPDWLGEEVSDDFRYFNVALAQHPFVAW